jgi:tetratricopeptide (TPR) repeat protein
MSPYVFEQLGDLYMEVELYSRAEEKYQMALKSAESIADLSAQGTAHTGLARAAWALGETEQAVDYLDAAKDVYRQAGETERARTVAEAQRILQKPRSSSHILVWAGASATLLIVGSVLVWALRSQKARNGK